MITLRNILYPTDFSDPSRTAFALACSLARDYGTVVVVLHVSSPPVAHGEVVARRQPDRYDDTLWQLLRGIQSPDEAVEVTHRLEEGDPAEVILRVARELDSGLIVMGTHGRTGLRRLLMGSVAERVLREAPCPVLTVKTPLPEGDVVAPSRPQEVFTT